MTSSDLLRSAHRALLTFGIDQARVTTLNRERNAVFRVEAADGSRLLLRLRSPARFSDVAARVQLQWLERLGRQTSIGAPVPLRTTSGRRFTHVEVGDERGGSHQLVC